MLADDVQTAQEICLDLDVLVTLTGREFTPKTRGILAAEKIERFVREQFGVRSLL